jgi:hypothetical protein
LAEKNGEGSVCPRFILEIAMPKNRANTSVQLFFLSLSGLIGSKVEYENIGISR